MVGRIISKELKEMALSMSLQGIRDSEIHEYTGISVRSLKRLRSTYRQNEEDPRKPAGRPQNMNLSSIQKQFLCDCVDRQYDIALSELQTELREVCGTDTSVQTIVRSLQQEGYTMKTITEPAVKRNEQERKQFKAVINTEYRPEQLVFANESHFNRLTMKRPYAWSKRGERASRHQFQFRGAKYSILPALSLDGILHVDVIENAITGADFHRFVEGLLPLMNKWPLPRSVLVIDDALIHKVDGIRELVEERGMRLLYLPSYSPDFNPIEHSFSSIKTWLHENRDRMDQERDEEAEDGTAYNVLSQAVHSVTAEQARGWFKQCGYILPV